MVEHTFTLRSSGNVALRGLAVQAPSLSGIACTPPLTVALDANSTITCHGVHEMTQDEVEAGVSQLSAGITAANLVPATGSSYSKEFLLRQVDLEGVASFSLAFASTCNAAPSKARKDLSFVCKFASPCATARMR
jgi:hypothetical protein